MAFFLRKRFSSARPKPGQAPHADIEDIDLSSSSARPKPAQATHADIEDIDLSCSSFSCSSTLSIASAPIRWEDLAWRGDRVNLPFFVDIHALQKHLRGLLTSNSAELIVESGGPCGRTVEVRLPFEKSWDSVLFNAMRDFIDAQSLSHLPLDWTNRELQRLPASTLVLLAPDSRQYEDIAQFIQAGADMETKSIARVENPTLFVQFVSRRDEIAAESGGDPNTHRLVHGTGSSRPETICESVKGVPVDPTRLCTFRRAFYLALEESFVDSTTVAHRLDNGDHQLLVVEAASGRSAEWNRGAGL